MKTNQLYGQKFFERRGQNDEAIEMRSRKIDIKNRNLRYQKQPSLRMDS